MYNVAKATALAAIAEGMLKEKGRRDARAVLRSLNKARKVVARLPREQQQLVALLLLKDYTQELFGMDDESDE